MYVDYFVQPLTQTILSDDLVSGRLPNNLPDVSLLSTWMRHMSSVKNPFLECCVFHMLVY